MDFARYARKATFKTILVLITDETCVIMKLYKHAISRFMQKATILGF